MTAWRLAEPGEEGATQWTLDGTEIATWISSSGNVQDVYWDWTDTTTTWTEV